MSSFKFPPPPPPPPKATATSNADSNTHGGHRGGQGQGHGHGRGDRGRARGSLGRGRGYFGGSGRGGHNDIRNGDRNVQSRGGPGGYQQQDSGRGRGSHRGIPGPSPSHIHQHSTSQLLPMLQSSHTSVNAPRDPTLASPALSGNLVPQVDQNTLAQAMSFMATPAGMQSMTAFANHLASVNTNLTPVSQPELTKPHNSSSPSGHKRKWSDRSLPHGSSQTKPRSQKTTQPSKKPPKAKCNTAPEIPSFGFTLPPTPASQSDAPPKPNVNSHKQKPKINLGLGQRETTYESSGDEDDVDEEAVLAAKYKVEGVVFEHNGDSISLQTPAEVAAWIKDRRRQFPTQKRIAQKAEEQAIQRAAELEFLRKVKSRSASIAAPQADQRKKKKNRRQRSTHLLSNSKQSHQEVRKPEVEDGPPKSIPEPKPIDLGLGYASDTGPDSAESSILSDSSVLTSSSESPDNTDSELEDPETCDDSDAPPESRSTTQPIAPVVVPLQHAVPPPQPKKVVCETWQRTGKCKYGRHCRNLHPREEEDDIKLVGLYERMVEQEREKSDKLALDAIKYLGRNGFLG